MFLSLPQSLAPLGKVALTSCLLQMFGEKYISIKYKLRFRIVSVLVGQVCALLAAPVVGGRYLSKVEELGSLDVNHFGVVTLTVVGGILGGVVNTIFFSGNRAAKDRG